MQIEIDNSIPIIERCLAVDAERCHGKSLNGQVYCSYHLAHKDDADRSFGVAIVPLSEFIQVLA